MTLFPIFTPTAAGSQEKRVSVRMNNDGNEKVKCEKAKKREECREMSKMCYFKVSSFFSLANETKSLSAFLGVANKRKRMKRSLKRKWNERFFFALIQNIFIKVDYLEISSGVIKHEWAKADYWCEIRDLSWNSFAMETELILEELSRCLWRLLRTIQKVFFCFGSSNLIKIRVFNINDTHFTKVLNYFHFHKFTFE